MSGVKFEPLRSLARNAQRRHMEMQCDPSWVLDVLAERDTLRAEVERCAEIAAQNASDAGALYAEVERLQRALTDAQVDVSYYAGTAEKLRAEVEQLRSLLSECADYLNINELTSIGHGSILHRKMMEASQCATTTGDTTTA